MRSWFTKGIRALLACAGAALSLAGCGGGAEPSQQPPSLAEAAAPVAGVMQRPALIATTGSRPQRQAQAAAALSVSPTELFDWAEATYPEYFPGHQTDQTLPPYTYRHYPATGNYIGLNGQSIVILGPISGGAVVEVGKLADFACLVRPALCNSPPVADAGPAQSVLVGASVKLDGSKSTDVDLNQLTFSWRFKSKPTGSAATLSDGRAVQPTFVADKAGQYVVELQVSDGPTFSELSSVTVTVTEANVAPVANAGPNQSVAVGATVRLVGSGSQDANGDALTFIWSFSARPVGSAAVLSGVTTANPTFVPDKAGTYTVSLVVNDGRVNSQPSTVNITAASANAAPIAIAGPDQTVVLGSVVTLSGSGSDADGDAITYVWGFLSKPTTSVAILSGSATAKPSFLPDQAGTYVVGLMVGDGKVLSAVDTVAVTVVPPTTGQVQLLLYGGSGYQTYLGCLTCGKYDSESVCNAYGNYGSPYSVNSIWNEYGLYGSPYGLYSPWNVYSVSGPGIWGTDLQFYGYFTANPYRAQRSTVSFVAQTMNYFGASKSISATRTYLCGS